MPAYYNENDKFAAQWLRNLIAAGHIAPGEVDERSIVDVKPEDLNGYTQHHFFAGIGGWSYALRLAGWPDDKPIWTGSCPCQPFSAAGKRKGFADERHLWPEWKRLIGECRPAKVLGEQVASASEWLRLVRGDLEAMGYAVGAMPIQAASAGADHLRERYWIVADDQCESEGRGRIQRSGKSTQAADERSSNKSFGTSSDFDLGNAESERRGEAWEHSCGSEKRIADASPSCNVAHAHDTRSQGRIILSECTDERSAGQGSVADAVGGRLCGSGEREIQQPGRAEVERSGEFEWVIGADGKARRVKPGIRLLVDGFPGRVGLLRGFGNAIDPRAAAIFIRAAS